MLKEKEIDQELEEEELPNKEKKPSWLEKLKNRLPKLSSSISAKLLACFVFAGYLFFFSSRLILPGGISAEYTPIGTVPRTKQNGYCVPMGVQPGAAFDGSRAAVR